MNSRYLIHKTYPNIGNAKDEQALIKEVMHVSARFDRNIKVVFNPEYYKKHFEIPEIKYDSFESPQSDNYADNYGRIFGIMITISSTVSTYCFEFVEFAEEE